MKKLSYAKLYGSWNQTGNVTLSPYQLNNAYSQSDGFPFGITIGFLPSLTNPNPNIQPEFVTSYEVGMQVGLFNHRLYLEAAYVYSDSDGQISNAAISRATGYNAMLVNSLLDYKNFSLGMQFDGRMGAWFYSETVPPMFEFGTHPLTAAYGRKPFVWPGSVIETESGQYESNTDLNTSGGGKEFWARQGAVQHNTTAKADFFKLREVNLSFRLPATWLANLKLIRSASLGLVATNLFIIRHASNSIGDPEYLYNSTDG